MQCRTSTVIALLFSDKHTVMVYTIDDYSVWSGKSVLHLFKCRLAVTYLQQQRGSTDTDSTGSRGVSGMHAGCMLLY